MKVGVDLLPKMDNYTDLHSMSLSPLMEGMHTLEALDMVRFNAHSVLDSFVGSKLFTARYGRFTIFLVVLCCDC
jgi:hypothetical protein